MTDSNSVSATAAAIAAHLHLPSTLADMLAHSVERACDRAALRFDGRDYSYGELGERILELGQRLCARAGKGAVVAIPMANSAECVVALLAAMAAGMRATPVNPFYAREEIAALFAAGAPDVILHPVGEPVVAVHLNEDTGNHAQLIEVDARAPVAFSTAAGSRLRALCPGLAASDPALMIFTGGTTGRSKAVEHSHAGLLHSVRAHATGWELRYDEERFLDVAPLFHIWGLGFAMLAPLYLRATLVLLPRYQPEQVLTALAEERITVFAGGPAPICNGLLASPLFEELSFEALTLTLTGGTACPQTLKDGWLQRVGSPLLEGWGMSEGAPLCFNWRADCQRASSVGRPAPGIVMRIVDVDSGFDVGADQPGEIWVQGPQVMIGYRLETGEPDPALGVDGWLRTGDIGYRDADGFLYLVDRKKELILVGGYNAYPRQIEEHLLHYAGIREVAVVGTSDPFLGETPFAFVVPEQGHVVDVDQVLAWCEGTLVKYKRPTGVRVVDALPRTGASKIDKRRLRRELAGDEEAG